MIWNNPFLGDTGGMGAPEAVPLPCSDGEPKGSTFQPIGIGGKYIDVVEPSATGPSSLAPGQFADVSNVGLLYSVPPLFIFGIGDNIAHAKTTIEVVRTPVQERSGLSGATFVPAQPIERVIPVPGAPLEAWIADWTGKGQVGAALVKLRIRQHDAGQLSIHVEDKSGHEPAVMDVTAPRVQGLTFPWVEDTVVAPSSLNAVMPRRQQVDRAVLQFNLDDPSDIVRARNWDNRRTARSQTVVADRVALSAQSAVEIYGAFERSALTPVRWKLRYLRWSPSGKTMVDLLCDGIKPIR